MKGSVVQAKVVVVKDSVAQVKVDKVVVVKDSVAQVRKAKAVQRLLVDAKDNQADQAAVNLKILQIKKFIKGDYLVALFYD